jgi:hypothetical protein
VPPFLAAPGHGALKQATCLAVKQEIVNARL